VATRLGATRSLQHRATVASPGEPVIHENLGKSVNTYRARAHTTTQDALSRGIYLLMLRIFGIAVDDEDARALVATLVSGGSTDASAAAARITAGLDRGRGLVALDPKHRDAILRTLEGPADGLAELRGRLADDYAERHGID
jgi:hypothetical protein